jgi:hypothetical protein
MFSRYRSILAVLIMLALSPEAKAFDPEKATLDLGQAVTEDIQHQRERARRDEQRLDQALDRLERQSPLQSPPSSNPRRSTQCTTIGLGGGDYATDCN